MKIKGTEYTFEDFKKLAAERPEFAMKTEVINGREFYSFFYNVAFENTFDTEISREFRGIVFDAFGEVVARPFHKFFNVGEREETELKNIWGAFYSYNEKHDGSLVYAVVIDGEVHLRTKKGFNTEVAQYAQKCMTADVQKAILYEASHNQTILFEFVAPKNRIIVPYKNIEFKTLAIRHNETGDYFFPGTDLKENLGQFIDRVRNEEDIEGYVVAAWNGGACKLIDFYKVKTEWYLSRHRIKNRVMFRYVFDDIVNGEFDDVLAFIKQTGMEQDVRAYKDYGQHIQNDFGRFNLAIDLDYPDHLETAPRSEFAEFVKDSPMKHFFFAKRDGYDYTKDIFKRLKEIYQKDRDLWLS